MRRIILLIALCCWSAQAATYYVATDGLDSRTAAQAQNIATPWRTIKKGVDNMDAGDTLVLRGGVYEEASINWPLTRLNGPSNEQRTTIKSHDGERAIFYPLTHTMHGINAAKTGQVSSNLTFSGFTIDMSRKNIEIQGTLSIECFKMYWVTNLTLTNMHFLNNTNGSLTSVYSNNGIGLGLGQGGNVHVVDCLFSNVSEVWLANGHNPKPPHPMYWHTVCDVLVERNTFYNGAITPEHNQGYGLHVYSEAGYPRGQRWTVRNNFFSGFTAGSAFYVTDSIMHNNVFVGIKGHGIGQYSINTRYANNTVIGDNSSGYGIRSFGYNDSFVNNVIWGTWKQGLFTEDKTGGNRFCTYTNNIFPLPFTATAGNPYLTGNTHTDPLFLNAPADLRIGSTSPARATGYDLSSVFTTDYYGNTRTVPWDRGAYLFNSQAPEEPEPPITDPDPLPLVSVSQTGDAFEINNTISTFVVSRAGSSDGNLNVVFTMTGSAESNVNYTISHSSPVTINNAEWTQTITLTPVDLGTVGTLDATLTIQPDAAYTVASGSNATVTIYGSGSGESGFRRTYGGPGATRRGRL